MSEVQISRDKVIEAIEREFGDEASPGCVRAKEAVYSVELTDAAPVIHAHWTHLGGGLAKCSNCKWIFKDVYDQDNEDTFCRKCGAKMDEVKNNMEQYC